MTRHQSPPILPMPPGVGLVRFHPKTEAVFSEASMYLRLQMLACMSITSDRILFSRICVWSAWEGGLEEVRDYRAEPPVGIDPIGASTDSTALLYKVIR